jgi:hypothetical protein
MAFLAALAAAQGSTEMEYTDVHGVCDVVHSQELFRAVSIEMAGNPVSPETNIFEGVELLSALILNMIQGPAAEAAS